VSLLASFGKLAVVLSALTSFYPLSVKHELAFVLGTLEYVVARLSSAPTVESSWKNRHLEKDGIMVGSFLNLHCGHNNPFSQAERKRLKTLLSQATLRSTLSLPANTTTE
jgi:hypothetical protein